MECIGIIICILVAIFLAIPLGKYISYVMNGKKVFLSKVLSPLELSAYKCLGIDTKEQMEWKEYTISVLSLSGIGFLTLFLLLLCQGIPILNPQGINGMSPDVALNTAMSFVTNTNWQAYNGEIHLSYLSQSLGLTVQNFISPAVGMAVLFAVIRGFLNEKDKKLGNFWVDIIRAILYVFIPLALILSIILVSQGVIQNFNSYIQVPLLENIFPGNGINITNQIIPQGPVASQVAINRLGSNGGGFFKANAAHPFENPTIFSNIIEMISMIIIPMSLCFAFGDSIKNKKHGIAIFSAMFFMFLSMLFIITICETTATPQLFQNGMIDTSSYNQSKGNMEGKESRIGTAFSGAWTAFSIAAGNGSMNSNVDSYTPLSGLAALFQMNPGNVILGGIGSGLYKMLAFIIIVAFIVGTMIGKTPKYLNKKIEPFEIKMAGIICFISPIIIILGSIVVCSLPEISKNLANIGPHGFSEIVYNISSLGTNNGSKFTGFEANTLVLNLLIAAIMMMARLIPMISALALAGSMSGKQRISKNIENTPVCETCFFTVLIIIAIAIGALLVFPILALGPMAEFFQMIS